MLLNTTQTKILVLYILDVAGCPIPLDTTNDIIAMCDINGFTIMEAFSELLSQGTIEEYAFEGERYIQPTVSTKQIIDAIGKEIPLSVREKASAYTMREIAKLRKQNNMTQQTLALRLDVTDKAVSKWESGVSQI